jgi:nucleoside-diphosphate-sugar epimerase
MTGRSVLLTGASSFTGLAIAEALADAGFQVVAPLLRERSGYDGERLARVERLAAVCEVVFGVPFASPAFGELLRTRNVSALAHHAADVTGYRDPGFDALGAFGRNTDGAVATLQQLAKSGATAVVVSGTVFEAGEGGVADEPLAVTPYGLSKTLTNIAFRHFADWTALRFGRFVIPSPYGVCEQQRSFPAYLFRSWFAGETPRVRTPLYLRDHLPAPLLGQAYARYLAALLAAPDAAPAHRPSGWIATQGDFARKLAAEAAARLGRECPLEFADQTEFAEPVKRVNDELVTPPGWDECAFWDAYVGWYSGRGRP